MKKCLIIILLGTLVLSCTKKETLTPTAEKQEELITIGKIDSLYSNVLEEQRRIWVHLPQSSSDSAGQEKKYPILYLLDGESHFYSVTGLITQLSEMNGNTVLPRMIIVAIENVDRLRDFTPTKTGEDSSGGGQAFLDFLENELFPYIDKRYPTADHKTIVGHSLGGLAAINALINRPHLFDNYLAIDPSLWWDDQLLLKKTGVFEKDIYKEKSMYVGVAKSLVTDVTGMEFDKALKDTTWMSLGLRSNITFLEAIDNLSHSSLTLQWKYYENEDHTSVPLITGYDGLNFLFSWHKLKGFERFLNPHQKTNGKDLRNLIVNHYETLSDRFKMNVLPPEELLNMMGYGFLSHRENEKVYELFKLNIENYPNSPNAHDAMADYYLAENDTIKAISYIETALKISGSRYHKKRLNELKTANH